MGLQIVKLYRDDGISGTKGQKHPQLQKLCLDAYNRKFELVLHGRLSGSAIRFTIWLAFSPKCKLSG